MKQPHEFLNADIDGIHVHGAREHNLKIGHLRIPRNGLVVVSGVSGSGKSTLAFDLLFAEGQRRFLDCMNAYARQFIEQLTRPDVDLITGLPPTVSIEQRNSRGGGKSTVATVTEVYHFIRLLFARVGTQYCPDCQIPVRPQSTDQLTERVLSALRRSGGLTLLAPVIRNRKGFHSEIAAWARERGYERIRADGRFHETSKPFRLDRFREHDVEIVTGRLTRSDASQAKAGLSAETRDLIETTLRLGKGTLFGLDSKNQTHVFSTLRACHQCGQSFKPLDPKFFSYNSSQGWCTACRGFGEWFYLPDVDRGARADAIEESWFRWQEGEREPCAECEGYRLNRIARAVRLELRKQTASIDAFSDMSVEEAESFFTKVRFESSRQRIAQDILPEIRERLQFLKTVGLGYLQLGRSAPTLSGGESQRIRLAAQLGSNLSGVLYILDEPTIGLHAHDNEQLLNALEALRDRGNSLVVVEHDEETLRRADHVIDLGPGAGLRGGEVVAQGTLRQLIRNKNSVTGNCLRHPPKFPSRKSRRPVSLRSSSDPKLKLRNANLNNLKNLSVDFPLGRFIAVTGLSGSGKSTLVRDCLYQAVQTALKGKKAAPGRPFIEGKAPVKSVYEVDQSPIGRTPRSTPATYVGFFDEIRALFASTPEARLRGYAPGRFSFNSPHGRCPDCKGAGVIKLEMNFLPTAQQTCETCRGNRFTLETLDIEYRGKTIADVLDMTVSEAREFFERSYQIAKPLEALCDTGLDYVKLGQTSPTLSGGEAQRVKLVSHLLAGFKKQQAAAVKRGLVDSAAPNIPGKGNLFILEEPTIGLHMSDVRRLVGVLQVLTDAGHTVIVIEHNLELIAESDWVVDLGPGGGSAGGSVVAQGPPEKIARSRRSVTGRYLKPMLKL